MTAIGPGPLQGFANIPAVTVRLAIGAEVIVDVIGSTRHGLAIRVGDVPFVLKTEAKLPEAKTLTLKIIEGANDTGRKVQVLASDDKLLTKSTQGELTLRSPIVTLQNTSDTATKDYQIDVPARLVTSDGRATGPEFTIRLTIRPTAGSPKIDLPPVPPTTSGGPGVQLTEHSGADPFLNRPARTPAPSPLIPEREVETTRRQTPPVLPADAKTSSEPRQFPLTPSSAGLPGGFPMHARPKEAMMATVVGRAPDSGHVLLQVADDLLVKVEQPIDLPVGTSLQMAWMAQPKSTVMPPNADSLADHVNPLVKLIELLGEIEQSGHKTTGGLDHGASRRLPMPDRDLAAKLLQLINVQMRQDVDDAGTTSRDEKAASPSKIHLIHGLLSDISDTASEPLADGWRGTTLPLGADPTQAVMIHQREHNLNHYSEDNDGDSGDAKAQRAVFDITFSHLGRCQIDAYCQEQRFDLLVRSERPLDQANQQAITNLFSSACEIAGLEGEIGYRHGQFVEPEKMPLSRTTLMT